jgi:hypothetical protein
MIVSFHVIEKGEAQYGPARPNAPGLPAFIDSLAGRVRESPAI